MPFIEGALVVIGKICRLEHRYRLLHDRRPRVHACAIREDVEKVNVFIRKANTQFHTLMLLESYSGGSTSSGTRFAYAQSLDTLRCESETVFSLDLERHQTMDNSRALLDAGSANT